jgi:hydroxyacylglutathione hydrolase
MRATGRLYPRAAYNARVLELTHFTVGPLGNNMYVLHDAASRRCAIVDPGIAADEVLDFVRAEGLKVELLLLTHAHFDHAYGCAQFAAATGAPIAMHPADAAMLAGLRETCIRWGLAPPETPPAPGLLLAHGQTLDVCGQAVEVRHTPGHCPGQVAYIWEGHCVSGDTLFHRGIGRYDLPGCSYEELERSIREQLFTLPDETRVWPGHGQPTSIGEERRLNPFIGEAARFRMKV